jgi:adenylate cyclase
MDETLANAWHGLARTYLRNVRFRATRENDLIQAGMAADRAIALKPTYAKGHLSKGFVWYEQGRMHQALAAFEHAAALDPNDGVVQSAIAAANLMLGRAEQAPDRLHNAMRRSPRDPELPVWHLYMGVTQMHLRRHAEAVEWLRRSLAQWPRDTFVHIFLTSALALSGREAEAQNQMAELLRLRPGFTLTEFKALEPSDDPTFLRQREAIYEGLRRAGAPQ